MKRSEQKRAGWVRHIRAWQASGQTRSAYCLAHGIKVQTLDYWRRRESLAGRSAKRSFGRTSTSLTLVPVTVTPSAPATPDIEVHCGGVRVCVPMGAAASWVVELVRGLRTC